MPWVALNVFVRFFTANIVSPLLRPQYFGWSNLGNSPCWYGTADDGDKQDDSDAFSHDFGGERAGDVIDVGAELVANTTEAAIAEAKTALEGTDIEVIKTTSEKLATTSQKLGTALYEQAQAAQASTGGPADEAGSAAESDDVVDAEIVDEGKNS